MNIKRLYVEQALHSGHEVTLSGDAAHYVGRVLRARAGDTLVVFNGDGRQWLATIGSLQRNSVALQVGSEVAAVAEPALSVCLWQALSRNEKMDLAIQKAVELGASGIRPVIVERSVMRLDEQRGERRLAHWQSVAVSAAQQCGRSRVPTVHPAQPLDDALAGRDPGKAGIVASPEADRSLAGAFSGLSGCKALDLLIGPEGGLTDAEVSAAVAHGFLPCRAGPRVLRTETAAIALLAIVQYALGDLGDGR